MACLQFNRRALFILFLFSKLQGLDNHITNDYEKQNPQQPTLKNNYFSVSINANVGCSLSMCMKQATQVALLPSILHNLFFFKRPVFFSQVDTDITFAHAVFVLLLSIMLHSLARRSITASDRLIECAGKQSLGFEEREQNGERTNESLLISHTDF